MRQNEQNLYRIDDVLLRTGGIGLLAALAIGVCGGWMVSAGGAEGAAGRALILFGDLGLVFLAALLCSGATLWAGFRLRRQEKRSLAIWELLRQNAEISVTDLVANSDFELADVDRTVRLLNNRGLGHYVWNRAAETVQDGRLRTLQLHVDKCEVCGGSVSLEVPIGFSEVPACPYCGDPVSVDTLETRRHEALDALRVDDREGSLRGWRDSSKIPFSIPIFLVLTLTFWPAGLAYAWYRCQNSG